MYITSNDLIDVNFHIKKSPELNCDWAYQEVVKKYLNKRKIEKHGYNWIHFRCSGTLPKKHSKKEVIYLDANGNRIDK